MTDFLKWMMTEGQKEVAGYEFAPLPQEITGTAWRLLSLIKGQ